MTKHRPSKLSISSSALLDSRYDSDDSDDYDAAEGSRIVPSDHIPAGRRNLPPGRANAINAVVRAVIRAEWESGETVSVLSRRHGVGRRTISRWVANQKWERSKDGTSSAILEHARGEIRRKVESSSIEVTAAIEDVVHRHKGTSQTIAQMLHEAMARALAYPHKDPFRQVLIIKIASEVARNLQAMDRKTWGFDENKTKTTTEIFDVLSSMETTANRQSIASESKSGQVRDIPSFKAGNTTDGE